MSFKVMTVIGTRPEIIKMAPLIEILNKEVIHTLIHSGQHYSKDMDKVFFNELELKEPLENLRVGSCIAGEQVARIIIGVEKAILEYEPDLVIVHGDTNTTLGAAIAASKYKAQGVMLAHVEAGARSHIPDQAEEINRKLVDQISDMHFAANERDKIHLLKEGLGEESILVTGNTVLESSLRMKERLEKGWIKTKYELTDKAYVLGTFHRQETVDDKELLNNLVDCIDEIALKTPVILPLHPRTVKRLSEFSLSFKSANVSVMEPVGYKDMTALLAGAMLCITDSGGLQEEAAVLGTPSFILRERTEHQKYIDAGFHSIVKPPFIDLAKSVNEILESPILYNERLARQQHWGRKGVAKNIYNHIYIRMSNSRKQKK